MGATGRHATCHSKMQFLRSSSLRPVQSPDVSTSSKISIQVASHIRGGDMCLLLFGKLSVGTNLSIGELTQ
jgi:hypothetical protein